MSFLKELKQDYRYTLAGWKVAKEAMDKAIAKGDTKTAEEERKIMQAMAHDLVKIADAMEREQ